MMDKTALDIAMEHAVLADRMLTDLQSLKDDLPPESPILDTIQAAYGILQTIWVQTQREVKNIQKHDVINNP